MPDINDLPDIATKAALWSSQQLAQEYEFFSLEIVYNFDRGTAKMPIQGKDGLKSRVVKVNAPTGWKLVLFAGRRIGQQPVLPVREADTDNQTFKKQIIRCTASQIGDVVGGVINYTVSGFYLYDLLVPLDPNLGDSLQSGQPPYFYGNPCTNLITPTVLDTSVTCGGDRLGRLGGYDQQGNPISQIPAIADGGAAIAGTNSQADNPQLNQTTVTQQLLRQAPPGIQGG
jgi:hypothetical protein